MKYYSICVNGYKVRTYPTFHLCLLHVYTMNVLEQVSATKWKTKDGNVNIVEPDFDPTHGLEYLGW